MTTVTTIVEEDLGTTLAAVPGRREASAVSWPAVFAGATAAAALTLILVVLGVGLGLAVVSPWSGGASTEAITWSTIAWTLGTAFAASGLGGYIAGRLRVRWPGTQRDEVYFRDTAHGFLAWAVATLITAAVLTSVIGKVLETPAQRLAAASMAESRSAPLSDADVRFLAQVIATQAGIPQADAEQRVRSSHPSAAAISPAQAEEAQRNAAYASLWIFVSLLVGAFAASWLATYGGRRRDLP